MSNAKNRPAGNGPALLNNLAAAPHHTYSVPASVVDALDPLPAVEALDPAHALVTAALQCPAEDVLALGLAADDMPGWTAIWTAILDLCDEGTNPDPALVLDRLTVTGKASPTEHNRLVRCIGAHAWPEQLPQYAQAVLAVRYADEFDSLAVSLTAATSAPQIVKERILTDHLGQLRSIRVRLVALRGVTG